MHLLRLAMIGLALASSSATAQDGDVVRLFSPVPNRATAAQPAPSLEAAQPTSLPAPAIRGALHDGAPAMSPPPSAADGPWMVAVPASTPAPFQPVR